MPNISEKNLQRLRKSVDELTALNEIASAINLSMSIESITSTILDNCLKRIPAAQGAVFLLEDESGDLPVFRTFVREITEPSESLPLHFNWSLLGHMIKNKQLLSINDPDDDQRFPGTDFNKLGIRSILAAPLIVSSGLLGALTLFNRESIDGFTSDDKRFLGIVATQTATVIENARLFEKQRTLHALEEEMKRAKIIQETYLPRGGFSADQYEILGFNQSAKDVGGDYYDRFAITDNEVILSIGDVAGKGIPAALMASEAQAVIKLFMTTNPMTSLPNLVESLNRLFVETTKADQYITAIIASYNISNRVLSVVNAGHHPPLVVSSSKIVEIDEGSGLVIGALDDTQYELAQYQLQPGDELFLFTDGITENFGPGNEEFGDERLRSFLLSHHGSDLPSVQRKLIAKLSDFRQGLPQSDDITFLHLKVK